MKTNFKHRATKSFWKLYDDLPAQVRVVADRNFELLKSDPYHPSLHFKKINPDIWSARVGKYYRAIAIPEPDGFAWIWIGGHAEYELMIK